MSAEDNTTNQPPQPPQPQPPQPQPSQPPQPQPPQPPQPHQPPQFTGPDPEIRRFLTVAFGILLIIVGISMFGGLNAWRTLDLLRPFRAYWGDIRQVLVAGALLIGGIALIVYRDRLHIRLPSGDRRLYRSREHKMIAGVIGGLADYFGTDPTLFRLIVVALAFLFDFWPFFVAYIVASIVIPEEPKHGQSYEQPPAPPAPPAP